MNRLLFLYCGNLINQFCKNTRLSLELVVHKPVILSFTDL
uniref:Uncharacterized protein n=1 Tax=Rhizophora mucronata TaxID=61149 RepID=A0A2P2P978_RHIMU